MRKHLLLYSILLLVVFAISVGYRSVLRYIDVIEYGGLVYKSVPADEADLAARPVQILVTNLKSGQWRLLEESFSDKAAYSRFIEHFQMDTANNGMLTGGFFERHSVTFAITTVTGLGKKNDHVDYTVSLELRLYDNPGQVMALQCLSSYDPLGKEYFIKRIVYIGDLVTAVPTGADTGIQIPDISKSPCVNASESGFSYIRLSTRKDVARPVEPALVLGENPNVTHRRIPQDYYNTDAIRQEEFQGYTFTYENPKWKECSDLNPFGNCDALFKRYISQTYYPGNVISQEDADKNRLGHLFTYIADADGVLQVPNAQGVMTDYPVGFFLDDQWYRLKALSSKGDEYHYGTYSPQGRFSMPRALAAVGKYLYVLDAGNANTFHVFSFELNGDGKLVVTFKGTSSLGLDLRGATDIAGFATPSVNVLYIANLNNGSITRVLVDPATGYAKAGTKPSEIYEFHNDLGERQPLGEVRKIAISPRNVSTGKSVLMALTNSSIHTYSTEGVSGDFVLDLNFVHVLPMGAHARNIGYNQGSSTFNVTDDIKGKVHVFSGLGEYLGSGGKFGTSEAGGELYYPNAISSNTFSGEAIEMIVCSKWGRSTGFKRFFPKADIGNIEVIERAPASNSGGAEDVLSFRFALTSGFQATSVSLKLNGQIIKTLTGSFFAQVYAENFLADATGANGLKGILRPGWNTYEVELNASIPGPANIRVPYQRTQRIQFHYASSSISVNTPIVHDKADNPLVIYKNTFISGRGNFSLSGGKTIIMPGCTLKVAKEVSFLAKEEDFELHCGSNLEVHVREDTLKTFRDCYFNGFLENYNLVSCKGDYSGGKGKGSGAASVLEFINCRFDNYIGKAVNIMEGRATVVNCVFESALATTSGNGFLTAAAIALDPGTRLDVRGGQFTNNDIAIDANAADVYIGHSASSYKGIKVSNPVFRNNQIALYTFGGHSDLKSSDFVDNQAAIISLSGSIDISKNRENLFRNNKRGIIFSDVLLAAKGRNRFISNEFDITFLAPPGDQADIGFELDCNYWEHKGTSGTPLLDIISTPSYDPASNLIVFNSIPYLESKQNSSDKDDKTHYNCTGGKSREQDKKGRHIAVDSLPYHAYHINNYKISQKLRQKENAFVGVMKLASSFRNNLVLGEYSNVKDTTATYHEALTKSMLSAYLYQSLQATSAQDGELYRKVYGLIKLRPAGADVSANYYVNATGDKLTFLAIFLGRAGQGASFEPLPVTNEKQEAKVYPNPTSGNATLALQITKKDHYTVEVFNGSGFKVATVLNDKELQSGNHSVQVSFNTFQPGLYFIKISGKTTRSAQTLKLFKQ